MSDEGAPVPEAVLISAKDQLEYEEISLADIEESRETGWRTPNLHYLFSEQPFVNPPRRNVWER